MGRPRGARDPKLAAMLDATATRPRLLAYCRKQYEEWFGEPWDGALAPLLLGADEIAVGDPLVRLARPPSLRGRVEPSRRDSREAREQRQLRDARGDVRAAIIEVTKATRAARSALTRLRSAAKDADATAERWKTRLVVESEDGEDWSEALAAGIDVVEAMLEKLPDNLDIPRPPRCAEPRAPLVERAAAHFDRPLAPRELAVIGILAGVAVQPRRSDTVADVLARERANYAQANHRQRRGFQ